jgi:hypothetical protein
MSVRYARDLFRDDPGISSEEIRSRLRSNLTPEDRAGLQFALCRLTDSGFAGDLEKELVDGRSRFEQHIINALEFAKASFGVGPETISLLTGLLSCYNVVMFAEPGDALYRYNDELLSSGRNKRLQETLEGERWW